LWFKAWRWRCSDLENDFPQFGKLHPNFFLTPSELLELEVEAEEMEDDLVLVGDILNSLKSMDLRSFDFEAMNKKRGWGKEGSKEKMEGHKYI